MTAKRIGRPTKCTPELVQTLADEIRLGVSLHTACECVGISQQTLSNWQHWHSEGKEPYATLFGVLKAAKGFSRAKAEKRIMEGPLRWESSARWLESMDPDAWRRRETRDVNVHGEIEVMFPDLDEPGVDGAVAAAKKRKKQPLSGHPPSP